MIKTVPLGELCSSINGLWKGKKEPFLNVGVIRNANFTKDFTLDYSNIEYIDVEERLFEQRNLQDGDLIIEKSGGSDKNPVGRAILYRGESGKYSFSNFTSVLRIKDPITLYDEYLYWYLLYIYNRGDTASMQSHSTGIHNLDFSKYKAISVPIPSLEEQKCIVEKLDNAFVKIDTVKANAENNLREAELLFNSVLAEEIDNREATRLPLEKIVDSQSFISYGIVQPGDDQENGVSIVRPIDLRFKTLTSIVGFKKTKQSISDAYKRSILDGKEILMCVRGTTGIVSMSSLALKGCNVTRGIVPLRIKDDLKRNYVYYVLLAPCCQKYIKEHTNGTALKQINIADVKTIPIAIPDSLSLQQLLVDKLTYIEERCIKLRSVCQNIAKECDALKQAILRKAFSGEL